MQITLDIDVQICRDLKALVVEVAKNFEAHHVVLDRCVVCFSQIYNIYQMKLGGVRESSILP
jgi:hypothetical protein